MNLAGREPRGILRPGRETEEFCRDLSAKLLEIRDEATGLPLVRRVIRTDDLYSGPRRGALPDLLVEWNEQIRTGTTAHGDGRGATVRVTSTAIGAIEGKNNWPRTGEHLPEGFFVLAGPGLPAGHRDTPVPLVDLHPTICRLLDLPDQAVAGAAIEELDGWTA